MRCQHLVEAFPIGGGQFLLDARRHPAAVVVVDLEPKARARRANRLPDAAHADDAQPIAADAVAEHQVGDQPGQRLSSGGWQRPRQSRRGTARISAMVMSAVSSVRTPGVLVTMTPRACAAGTSMLVDAVAEIGDHLRRSPALASSVASMRSVTVGYQHVGGFHGIGEFRLAHRLVVEVEVGVEQLPHAGSTRSGSLRVITTRGFLALAMGVQPLLSAATVAKRHRRGGFADAVQSSLTRPTHTPQNRPKACGARPF